ncbi:MAG: 4Fe-4S binding protein, partial [Dehalococcoidia bacterium]|nr:4Fe-4S binding protein [Dehalococcoidia bacterium]
MVVVDETKCLGCGICTHFCPVDALQGYGIIEIDRGVCT